MGDAYSWTNMITRLCIGQAHYTRTQAVFRVHMITDNTAQKEYYASFLKANKKSKNR